MSTHTDSHIVERHDDGTWTETIVVHGSPATKKEKVTAFSILGALVVAPFLPLVAAIGYDRWEQRRARKEADKKLKSV